MKAILALFIANFLFIINSVYCQGFSVKETFFNNESMNLVADIYIPDIPKGSIGIALIQGSGDSHRGNVWSKSFAELLAASGYYVLLPDKRGSGKSDGSWKKSSFENLASDAIASVHHLRDEMHLEQVGIMGLSQGGFIAPLVAAKEQSVHFVINISGAAVTLEEQIIHEVSNTAVKEALTPSEIKEVLELHVLMKQYAFDKNWLPLGRRFSELESSSWSSFSKTFPNSPDHWVWDWIKLNINYDPMFFWQQVHQDVFVAYGSRDQNDNIPVYESVYRLQDGFNKIGKKNYKIKIYSTGHAMYEDDMPELRKEFLADLLNWLKIIN